jgi:hypothetical protein
MASVPEIVFAILDGVARVWDWTPTFEGPPTYTFEYGGRQVRFDDRTAAAIHHDWVKVGGDLRRAMDKTGRPAVGKQTQP